MSNLVSDFDLAIIGLGPAGLRAAEIAVNNGLKVIAFEENEIGGTCLNCGCVPTKAILKSAKLFSEIKKASDLGIEISGNVDFDWQKIIQRKDDIVSKFNKNLNLVLSKKLTLVKDRAELVLRNENLLIKANNSFYKAKNIILATGSKPVEVANLKFDHNFIVDSSDILKLNKLPKSILIVGSGAIGLEMANILALLNVEVKLVEKAPSLAPKFDIDIQKRIERTLKLNKIEIFKNDFVTSVKNNKVTLNSGALLEVDCILSAVGRKPDTVKIFNEKNNSFETLEIKNRKTNFKNLFVVGDLTASFALAHAASFQAQRVMDEILNNKTIEEKLIPSVIYLTPEIASIGLNEQDISDKTSYSIKKLLIAAIAKSWCDNLTDGFIKLIIKDNLIKGAHIMSNEAGSLITLLSFIIENNVTLDKIKEMVFAHPEYVEIIYEAIKND